MCLFVCLSACLMVRVSVDVCVRKQGCLDHCICMFARSSARLFDCGCIYKKLRILGTEKCKRALISTAKCKDCLHRHRIETETRKNIFHFLYCVK